MNKIQISKSFVNIFIVLLFLSLLISPCITSINTLKNVRKNSFIKTNDDIFDLKMRSLMYMGYIPSVTSCIVKNDEVVWTNGYGFYDFSGMKKPDKDTIYQVASVSKTITATAILQLYENGLFNLDDDVNTILPFSLRNPKYPDTPITFRMLLAHHSSLHDHDKASAYEYFAGDYDLSFVKELFSPEGTDYLPELWGDNKPGTGGNYSNMGFTILGYIVELVSNQSFEKYCQENIFQPLGMDDSSFVMNSLPEDQLACSYLRIGRIYLKVANYDYTFLDPCGGFLTSVDDLSKFLIVHMNDGMYGDIQILKKSTIDEMHSIQYPNSAPYYGTLYFGLGWLIFAEEFGHNAHGHDGDLTFSHARMRILEDGETAIIYLFNKGYRGYLLPITIPYLLEYIGDQLIRKILYEKAITNY